MRHSKHRDSIDLVERDAGPDDLDDPREHTDPDSDGLRNADQLLHEVASLGDGSDDESVHLHVVDEATDDLGASQPPQLLARQAMNHAGARSTRRDSLSDAVSLVGVADDQAALRRKAAPGDRPRQDASGHDSCQRAQP